MSHCVTSKFKGKTLTLITWPGGSLPQEEPATIRFVLVDVIKS